MIAYRGETLRHETGVFVTCDKEHVIYVAEAYLRQKASVQAALVVDILRSIKIKQCQVIDKHMMNIGHNGDYLRWEPVAP